jgi:hypothetical protein
LPGLSIKTRGKHNFACMRDFPDYGNNAASHTVVGHHFEPNPFA